MRRALAGVPVITAVVAAWSTVEVPRRPLELALAGAAGAALLAVPAGRRVAWAVGAVLGAVALACVATRSEPLAAIRDVAQGIRDASAVSAPFDPAGQQPLHALVVLVGFAAAAAVARLVAGGRPLAAGAVAAVAVAWPATLTETRPVAWGCVAAAVALWPSLVLRASGAPAALAGASALAVVVVGVAAAGTHGFGPGEAHVEWRGWDPLAARSSVDVRYVWDASYSGIRFPLRPTVVLRIAAPHRALYWRASTLDYFVGDRWIENLYPVALGRAQRDLPADPLVPQAARRRAGWVRQTVVVEGLDDRHLLAATQPMRVESSRVSRVFFLSGGVMVAPRGIDGGARYTVWSYAPRPTPQELAAAPARYPPAARRYLDVGRARMPTFGAPGRDAAVNALFAEGRNGDIRPYRPIWVEARRLTAGTASPYLATLALERWLRDTGGYTYDEQPPRPPAGTAPLLDFALGARRGYCQHFAGTMALMLRTLGVPARVAVGFTSGSWSKGEWTVTDHQAHAWVEAWFPGHGWLPFDPTPGRGTFSAPYSFAADSADAVRALGTGRLLDFSPQPGSAGTPQPTAPVAAEPAARPALPLWPLALLLLPVAAAVATVVLKRRRRVARLSAADPRERAEGIRRELADALRDRGLPARRTQPLAELARAVERGLDVHPDRLVELTATARYAPPALAGPAAQAATDELLRLEAAIVRRSGRARALLATLRPGSLRGA